MPKFNTIRRLVINDLPVNKKKTPGRATPLSDGDTFVAIDFETADQGPDSACAVGLVKVSAGRIVDRLYHLIRPPRKLFLFSYIHGIDWNDVKAKPTFVKLWPEIRNFIGEFNYFAAHNASFDKRVLHACCEAAEIAKPPQDFICTVQLARKTWRIFPTKLPNVCDFLGIELNHHEALSDAEACARIVIAAAQQAATAA